MKNEHRLLILRFDGERALHVHIKEQVLAGGERRIHFALQGAVIIAVDLFPLHELTGTDAPPEFVRGEKKIIFSVLFTLTLGPRRGRHRKPQGRVPPQDFPRDGGLPRAAWRGGSR